MKKSLLPFLIIICSMIFSLNVFAGDINSEEQRILNVISKAYPYDGFDYKVTDVYYQKVVEYLSRDNVNMTKDEVSSYILQFLDNIPAGIAGGYMEKVGITVSDSTSKPSKKPSKEEESSENTNSEEENSETENTPETEPDATVSDNQTSDSTDKFTTKQQTAENTPAVDNVNVQEVDKPVVNLEDHTIAATTDGVVEYTVQSYSAVMYVWDVEELEVHKEAYKDSDVIGTYIKGEQVNVTGATSTGWAQVDYNGETGYVSVVYLRTTKYMADNEIEKNEQTGDYTEAVEEKEQNVEKDYSDATPLSKSVSVGAIALIVMIIVIVIAGGVVLYHKSKHRRR